MALFGFRNVQDKSIPREGHGVIRPPWDSRVMEQIHTPQAIAGGCFCGKVGYAVSGVPFGEANCHCSICRRVSGAPFVAWFTVRSNEFRWTKEEPATLRSSGHAVRTFCSNCGTPLTFVSIECPGEIDVTTCSLEDPTLIPPKEHIHVDSKLPWVHLSGGLPESPGKSRSNS